MRHIDPDTIPYAESHRYLLCGVAPRPIALVGTLDTEGRPNLSPFSFYNAFGTNPPVIAFSPAYRGTNGLPKHTFLNIKATGEFTVSAVSYAMVEQISLASGDFAAGVDEFEKSGLTKLPSQKIKPSGVAESPMVMECRLLHHIDFGGRPGSGNLMIAEVVMFHIMESAFVGNYPEANRLDLVARMGGNLYCRASGAALFAIDKPGHPGMGFGMLPDSVRNSRVLTGNDLAKLAGVRELPDLNAVAAFWRDRLDSLAGNHYDSPEIELRVGDGERAIDALLGAPREHSDKAFTETMHRIAQVFLHQDNLERAWQCVMLQECLAE